MNINTIHHTDCLTGLQSMDASSVHCCVTSPPYWGLRDYGVEGQLGLEDTPEVWVDKMVEVFREVKRVLRDDGTLWLNLGDTYAGGKIGRSDSSIHGKFGGMELPSSRRKKTRNYKHKDLVGIPWMLAFALRSDGWYLRQDIIWHKPNPMPESVSDRCTKAHEYIFLLSKSRKYYYDQESIMETASENSHARVSRANGKHKSNPDYYKNGIKPRKSSRVPSGWDTSKGRHDTMVGRYPKVKNNPSFDQAMTEVRDTRNKRSVWSVSPKAFNDAHFATFPEKLIEPCIKAGCPEGGIVLDPFMGAGTTAVVASKLNRNYIGFELNQDYLDIANKRLSTELGLFNRNAL